MGHSNGRVVTLTTIVALVLSAVAGVQLAGALNSTPSSQDGLASSPGEQSKIRQAFPVLARTSERAPGALPTRESRGTDTSEARLTAKGDIGSDGFLALTGAGELCLEVGGTSTCQRGNPALQNGVFVAELDCAGSAPLAAVRGVAPAGVGQVEVLLRGSVVGRATPGPNGLYRVEVPGAAMDAVRTGDSVAPFVLACPPPSQEPVQASPIR